MINHYMRALAVAGALICLAEVASAQAPQAGRFGFDETGMDRSVRPGDDFYAYANGTWVKSTPIAPDRSTVSLFTRMADANTARVRDILDAARRDPSSRMGAAYASYLDHARVERLGMTPIKPWLDRVLAVHDLAGYRALLPDALRLGISLPMAVDVQPDDGNPDVYTAIVSQAGLGMPDRSYYLSTDAPMPETRSKYVAWIAQMLALAGQGDAAKRANAVMAFEAAIAKVSWTPLQNRDATHTYNPTTLDALERTSPNLGFGRMLGDATNPSTRVVVMQPDAIAAIDKLVAATPVAVLRDALLVQTLHAYADVLPDAVADADFAFHGKVIDGSEQRESREERAAAFAVAAVPDDVGKAYVARWFTPQTKVAALDMVKGIIAAMDRRIDALDWMTPATKQRAHAKLRHFTPRIGYPDRWHDYGSLAMHANDLAGNAMRARQWRHAWDLGRIGKPLDRWEWTATPMTVDAFANYPTVAITFPAAILQPPFFDPHADAAVNYGGIGAVIGHELSHQFDDQGAKYDERGRLATWWTPADLKAFQSRTNALVHQFDQYQPLPGMHVNGGLTLGENIADLAGLTVAYDAYKASPEGRKAAVIDGFTGDQRFYLGWAQLWRYRYRDADLRRRLLTNGHSPGTQRVWTMRNLDSWNAAYSVGPGMRLYLPPAERVRIW
ncbi:MAG: M13 family metallopeptidase [Luteibacter sp.]